MKTLLLALNLTAGCLISFQSTRAEDKPNAWPADIEQVLTNAGKNRAELEKALIQSPVEQRKGMEFLVVNMPDQDLLSLSSAFLLENLELAYKARNSIAWGKKIPEEIFFNNVLPYANVDESRDPWRKELYELCMPLIKDCKSAGEAAHLLNSTIFNKLKVHYSTKRRKAQQSPKESMETGTASCTGLSILLSDACRSMCIPTRVVGTPMWADKRGNHTWLEIWDGDWHFTGACEPDPKGLDRGWFVGDAAQAKKDVPEHAIYAASFQKTKTSFPLIWAPNRKDIFAENVTDRYARKETKKEGGQSRVLVRVWNAGKKTRAVVPVKLTDRTDPSKVAEGQSHGETADANDILAFPTLPDHEYLVQVGADAQIEKRFKANGTQLILEIELAVEENKLPPSKPALAPEQNQQFEKEVAGFFAASAEERAKWKFDGKLDRLLADHEPVVRAAAWKAYQSAPIHVKAKKDFDEKLVRNQSYVSAYTLKEVGKRPKDGWPLFIAMHGGGGAPKQVNDQQWQHMQIYYKDQASVTGYKYVALRAPNDTWNGFYDTYVPPLIINLIEQFSLFGDVDVNKVYLMGYSHGGYGAFYIGPKIPDRFAAVHCSASAPTDGTISPLNLRNTRFTFMIGENDTMYGRRERCERFSKEIEKLKSENKGEFPVEMEFKKGFGHGGLPDRDKIKEMYPYVRNVSPKHLSFEATDPFITEFFWLSVPKPGKGQKIDAIIREGAVVVATEKVKEFDLCLDGRLISYGKPLLITVDGITKEVDAKPSLLTLCQSLVKRGDPELAYTCAVRLTGKTD